MTDLFSDFGVKTKTKKARIQYEGKMVNKDGVDCILIAFPIADRADWQDWKGKQGKARSIAGTGNFATADVSCDYKGASVIVKAQVSIVETTD